MHQDKPHVAVARALALALFARMGSDYEIGDSLRGRVDDQTYDEVVAVVDEEREIQAQVERVVLSGYVGEASPGS